MSVATERREWTNWSRSVRFTPGEIVAPSTEEEVVDIVRRARRDGRRVRPVGRGHSSTPLMATDDVLVETHNLSGVVRADREACVATLRGGTGLEDIGPLLHEHGLALENFGDVAFQAIAGAIGTGTHGTGGELGNFSRNLLGFRVVTGTGDVVEVGADDVEELRAGRVALGALGIMTELTLRVVPAFRLRRLEWCVHLEDCMARYDELVHRNRNFDFYWHPRRDEAQIRILNEPGTEPEDLVAELPPERDEIRKDGTDWSFKIQPQQRGILFDEMEHALPYERFREAFAETRERVKAEHRKDVAWRVLCRTVAPDDGFLSPFLGRNSTTIAHLQNATLDWKRYFADMEPRMRAYGGRPHLGKKHTAAAADLRAMGLEVDRFDAVRERFDPDGVFLNDHLRELLGLEDA
jgi:FAD/FMN-containing dehydrogenase